MSIYDKSIKNVAEAAAKIMGEALKGNQHKIDANKNNKIDSHDFKLLRAGKKPEQVKESGEMGPVKNTMGSVMMKHKTSGKEINIINTPEAIKQHQARGYEKLSTVKKEEVEQLDELSPSTLTSYRHKARDSELRNKETVRRDAEFQQQATNPRVAAKSAAYAVKAQATAEKRRAGIEKATSRLSKEEVELQEMSDMIDALIQEYESKGGTYRHKGTYGYGGKGAEHGETDYKKENDLSKATEKPAKKKYGSRQNYVRSTRVNESFSELLQKYTEGGVKSLNESMYVLQEEADNDQFTAELEKSKKKDAGQDRNDKAIAAGATQSVKSVSEEVDNIEEAMSHQAATTMKHIKPGTLRQNYGDKKDAANIKPGISGVADRLAMLNRAKKEGRLKEDQEQIDENLPMTSLKPGHDEKAARFLARQVKGTPVKGKAQSAPQKEGGMKKVKEEVEQLDEGPFSSGALKPSKEFLDKAKKVPSKGTIRGKDHKGVYTSKTVNGKEVSRVYEDAEQVDERTMTEPEMKERERIVKGMKKGLSGFKQRYGERAKSVLYATASKQAMKEESESEHYKAGHDYASDHAQDSGFKVTARARKKEMLSDNPHKKGTPEHADWHKGALAGHQMALDNM